MQKRREKGGSSRAHNGRTASQLDSHAVHGSTFKYYDAEKDKYAAINQTNLEIKERAPDFLYQACLITPFVFMTNEGGAGEGSFAWRVVKRS
jgi:hypothetical protein